MKLAEMMHRIFGKRPADNSPPLSAWREAADATDTGILTGIASRSLTARDREYLQCVAWRLATLLDHNNGGNEVRCGLARFFSPPAGVSW